MSTAVERLRIRKAAYYRKHKDRWAARSAAEAARRRADPELREAFNAKQREYYAKKGGKTGLAPVPKDESEALKRAWDDRF